MAEALAIRLVVQNGNVVKAELKGIGQAGQTSLAKIEQASRRATTSLEGLGVGSLNVSNAMRTLAGAVSAYVALDAARKVVELSDAYTNLQTKLNLATGSTEAAAKAQKSLFDIAQETRTPLDDTVRTYQRLAPAFREAGVSAEKQMSIMRSLGQSMLASGATAGEAASAMLQFAQAMGKGRLNGDELRSMMENWPALMRRLAEAFGVPVGMLTTLGEQGVITSDKIIQALLVMQNQFAADAAKVQTTFEQSQVQLRNQVELSIGQIAKQSGVTVALVDSVNSLRDAIASPEFQRGATALAEAFVAVINNATKAAEKIGVVIQFVKDLQALDAASATWFDPKGRGPTGVGADMFDTMMNLINPTRGQNPFNAAFSDGVNAMSDYFKDATKSAVEFGRVAQLAQAAALKPNFAGAGNFRGAQDVGTLNNKSLSVIDTWRPVRKQALVPLDAPTKAGGDGGAAAALKKAQEQFAKDEEVILQLLQKMREARDERERAVQQAADRLSEWATDEQIARAKELAGQLYDQAKAYEAITARRQGQVEFEKQALKLNQDNATAADQFMRKMQQLDNLRNYGLSTEAYTAEAQAASDTAQKVEDSFARQRAAAEQNYAAMASVAKIAFQGISSGLADMLVEGEWNIEQFLKSIMKQFIQAGIQQGLMSLFTMATGNPAATTGFGGANAPGGFGAFGWHGGGVVGVDKPAFVRPMPYIVYADAPRMHQGYFAPGEYPAVLQKGESVLTPAQMRQVAGAGGGINVEINNYSSERVSAQQTGGGLKVTIGQMVAGAIMDRGSPANRAIQGMIDKSSKGR